METMTRTVTDLEIRQTWKKFDKGIITPKDWWDIRATYPERQWRKVINKILDAQERINKYKNSTVFKYRIRKYINQYGYSDVNPYEVVKIISEQTVLCREMDAVRDPAYKPEYVVGGFSAICTNNNEQKWIITPNPNNKAFRLRLSAKGWGQGMFQMSDTPVKHYDYNF